MVTLRKTVDLLNELSAGYSCELAACANTSKSDLLIDPFRRALKLNLYNDSGMICRISRTCWTIIRLWKFD